MVNVIRAQAYQVLRENYTYYCLLAGLLLNGFGFILEIADSGAKATMTGSYWVTAIASTMPIAIGFIVILLTTHICGSDMEDGTLNYEVLTGTRRSRIYMGRFTVSLICCLISYVIIILLPTALITLIFGWGNTMTAQAGVRRLLLVMVPVIKQCCLYTMLTFVTMQAKVIVMLGFIITLGEAVVEMFELKFAEYFLTLITIGKLYDVQNYGIGFIDGEDVTVLKDTVTSGELIRLSAVTLAAAAVMLCIGGLVFKKRDITK